MKQHRLAVVVAFAGLVLAGCDSSNNTTSSVKLDTSSQKASYGIGLNMGKTLSQEGMTNLDSKAVALGIDDALSKKDQRIKDKELVSAFSALQKEAKANLAAKAEKAKAAGDKFLADNAKQKGVITTDSGLQYKVLKKTDGPQPTAKDTVTVNYVGKLTDGTVFDSSVERKAPIDLPVNGVIKGWSEALQLMHLGEKYKLYIPSKLAYGDQSPTAAIPANSTLVFEIELLDINGQKKAKENPKEAKAAQATASGEASTTEAQPKK